jgi:ATP-dependent RNA helicase SUPV3L1/SUV3
VAKLGAGPHPLNPTVELLADELLKGDLRERVQARLELWVSDHIGRLLEPLVALWKATEARTSIEAGGLPGPARGLAFQLAENLGQLDRSDTSLPDDLRAAARPLRLFGVRIGRRSIFLPKLTKPASSALAAMLWAVHRRLERIPSPPAPGLTSFAFDREDAAQLPDAFLAASFFRRVGPRAVRLDMLERIEETLSEAAETGRNAEDVIGILVSLLGSSVEEANSLAGALGWERVSRPAREGETQEVPVWRRARKEKHRRHNRQRSKPQKDSPFARLADLIPSD